MNRLSLHRSEKIAAVVSKRQRGFALVLEDIHDPHNAAAILRSADAFGIFDIRLIFSREHPYDPKIIGKSSSSSANKWMNYITYTSTGECCADLKKENYHIFTTALHASGVSPYSHSFVQPSIAVIFGNEHRGVSKDAIQLADTIITIPMNGMVESLNVSVSAACIIAEITRQRSTHEKLYGLSPREQQQLRDDYQKR